MTRRELLPGEYAVLAMLKLGPKHGYEMARFMDRDGLPDVTRIEQSLLYANLKNLERRDLIAGCEVRAGAHPPRRVFHLTPPGEVIVDEWLRQPVERLREVRLDFMLKLYFLHRLDPVAERVLLRAQIGACEGYRDRVVEQLARGEPTGFQRLVLGSKASGAIATLEWLRAYEAELDEVQAGAGVAR